VVHVAPAERPHVASEDLDLGDLFRALWRGKWLIGAITTVLVSIAVVYSLTATEWYRAEVLMTPAEERSAQGLPNSLGNLGGLANLAGIRVGGRGSAEPLALLQSRGFLRGFIEDHKLLETLAAVGGFSADEAAEPIDIRDAVEFFREAVLRVTEEAQTGLVTVAVEWTDAAIAAEWANALVERVNEQMRERSLQQAESNVNYLKVELAEAQILALQQSIGRLLESELQKAMLARVNDQFAFRIIDEAEEPNWRFRPRRSQIVGFTFIVGVFVSSLIVIARHIMTRQARPAVAHG
jgi:uncharacterized protein involved in exopolysaccharide biosynthesis